MKIDKQTLMLFGGGIIAGYFICKYMSKPKESVMTSMPQDAPVEFGADGLMRAGNNSPQPTIMGSTSSVGMTFPHPKSRRRN